MEIFIHKEGAEGPELVVVEEMTTVGEIGRGHGGDEFIVWLEEEQDPLDPTKTLIEVGVVEKGHIHVGRCRHVEVTVRYGGESKSREFTPSKTIESVFTWATGDKAFNLSPKDRSDHTFVITGTETEPGRRTHVGSLAKDCKLSLDLVLKHRFQG